MLAIVPTAPKGVLNVFGQQGLSWLYGWCVVLCKGCVLSKKTANRLPIHFYFKPSAMFSGNTGGSQPCSLALMG